MHQPCPHAGIFWPDIPGGNKGNIINILKVIQLSSYCIALMFRGSKFSRIAALEEFVEKISRIHFAIVCYSTVAKILVE